MYIDDVVRIWNWGESKHIDWVDGVLTWDRSNAAGAGVLLQARRYSRRGCILKCFDLFFYHLHCHDAMFKSTWPRGVHIDVRHVQPHVPSSRILRQGCSLGESANASLRWCISMTTFSGAAPLSTLTDSAPERRISLLIFPFTSSHGGNRPLSLLAELVF